MEPGPSTEGLAAVSVGLAVVALRWHWCRDWAAVPGGHSWRGLPGVTLSSPGARHCTLPWGRGVRMGRFLVPSNGHRPGDLGEDRDCASLAASARAFAALRGALAGACPELRTSTLRSSSLPGVCSPSLGALSLPR